MSEDRRARMTNATVAVDILRRSSPEATQRIRSSIASANERSLHDQLEVEQEHQRLLIPMNMGEGAAAFMDRREPDFDN
jgi:enoyl-CoA hydratase/carnithine racemase